MVAFTALGVRRAAASNFDDDVSEIMTPGDDWLTYKLNAVSILEQGWRIPRVETNYYRPGGFFYNYFVAGMFAVTGVNSSHVYVAQSALLGLSVALIVLAFRPYLAVPSQFLLAGVLAGAAYVDMFRNYTFRLLSENLVLATLALFWLLLCVADRRRDRVWPMLAAGAAFGLSALTRPNIAPIAPVLALVLWWAPGGFSGRRVAVFLLAFCATMSLMVIRNYAVTGDVSLAAVSGRTDWVYVDTTGKSVLESARMYTAFYGRRVLFTLGFMPVLHAVYRVRPHWLMAWAGLAAFLVVARGALVWWELAALAFVAAFLGPLIVVGHIDNYGFRMLAPAMPIVMLLAVRFVDRRLRGHV